MNDLDNFGIDGLHISDPAGRISKSDGDPAWNWREIVAHSLQQEAEIERLKGTGRIYLYCYGFMKPIWEMVDKIHLTNKYFTNTQTRYIDRLVISIDVNGIWNDFYAHMVAFSPNFVIVSTRNVFL